MSSSYSSPNEEIVRSSLVPQEAIDAAWDVLDEWGKETIAGFQVRDALEAALPHILEAARRDPDINPLAVKANPEPDLGVLPWDELEDTRSPECVKRWPECESGAYDPACCRFPKSCSYGELEAGVTERLHGTDDTERLHEAGDN